MKALQKNHADVLGNCPSKFRPIPILYSLDTEIKKLAIDYTGYIAAIRAYEDGEQARTTSLPLMGKYVTPRPIRSHAYMHNSIISSRY